MDSHLGNTDVDIEAKLPFSQACENNKVAILTVLQKELKTAQYVLEIGSGTGQHSVYFAPRLSHLSWQCSDVANNLKMIQAWHHKHPAINLPQVLALDLATADSFPKHDGILPLYDTVFTANTLHIVPWSLVERLFSLIATQPFSVTKLIIYGPFNDQGKFTSAGNAQFDAMLRARDPQSGIRDKGKVVDLAHKNGFMLASEYAMPANNKLLVFQKIE